MKTTTFSATFDGEHIRLEDNLVLPKNARLLVTLRPDEFEDEAAFRAFWRDQSSQSLARAYGAGRAGLSGFMHQGAQSS